MKWHTLSARASLGRARVASGSHQLLGEQMKTMQVLAVADDQMPEGHEWAVVREPDRVVMLVRASTVTRSRESERLLNEALSRAS